MKVVVVGGVAGGGSAAARIRRVNEQAEIIMIERGEHVGFSNCCLPYHLSGQVPTSKKLILMPPAGFKNQHNIDVRVLSEVTDILRDEKCVVIKNLATGEEYKESYDKLILAPGANAIKPRSIGGVNNENVFTIKNVTDITAFKSYIEEKQAKNIVVAGGGFIGLEVAENLKEAGYKVSLVEGADQIMMPLDKDIVQILHKEMMDQGLDLYLNSMVSEITENSVIAKKGEETIEIPADAVVLSIGVAPETTLAAKAGLEIGGTRGIKVNNNYQTSDPDIYAVGDAVEKYNMLERKPGLLALAGPAQWHAHAAADHINSGISTPARGYIGSSCIRLFSQNAACTGMNEKACKRAGIHYEVAYVLPPDKVGIMPESHYMAFKLIFEVPTGKILGAQAVGKGDVVGRVNVIATMITMGGTLEQLKELELCYSPVFATAKDVVNMAALVGLNILSGRNPQVHVDEVRDLVLSGAYIIDVREVNEYEAGHIKGAVNIPLSQFRTRIDEVPRDIPVYLHCRSSQRSYYALCQLKGHGYTNVKNISGSYLGISLHEYYPDQAEGRESILTQYNFN